nr:MAG TPA: hypothetical protein [Caudoviricetes sp.]
MTVHRYAESELILLKYIDGYKTTDRIPNYFSTLHKIDVDRTLRKFASDKLLVIAPIEYTLRRATVSSMKQYLKDSGLKPVGKKDDLIRRVLSTDLEAIEKYFPDRYYTLTELGMSLLSEKLPPNAYGDRFDPILNGFDEALAHICSGEYRKAEDVLIKAGHEINRIDAASCDMFFAHNIRIPGTIDECIFKAHIILYHMYGVRTMNAQKDFEKRTGVSITFEAMHKTIRVFSAICELNSAKSVSAVKYTIRTMNDERVCDHCRNIEGIEFDVDDAIIGVNYPPFDGCTCGYCRCYASIELK